MKPLPRCLNTAVVSLAESNPQAQRASTMTTQEQPITDAQSHRRYQVFWNDDGEYESQLTYTSEQLRDIDKIVYAVVRGMLDKDRFDITVTEEPNSEYNSVNP